MIKNYGNKTSRASGQGVNSDHKQRVFDALFDFHNSRKNRKSRLKTRKTRRKSSGPVRLGELLPGMLTDIEQRQPELARQNRMRIAQVERSPISLTDGPRNENSTEAGTGGLLKEIPKQQGKRSDKQLSDSGVGFTKQETIKELGFEERQAQRFEQLAEHPAIVEQVKAEVKLGVMLENIPDFHSSGKGTMKRKELPPGIDKKESHYAQELSRNEDVIALKLEPLIAVKARKRQKTSTGGVKPQLCQKSDKAAINTKKELARIAGVSHDTIGGSD